MILPSWPHRNWTQIPFILLVVGLSLLIRKTFLAQLGATLPYVTFYPAAFLAALFGGFRAGVAATLCSLIAAYIFIIDIRAIPSFRIIDYVIQAAFPLISIANSYLIEKIYLIRDRDRNHSQDLLKVNQDLLQQKTNYQALVENLPFLIIRLNKNLDFLYVNPLFEQETGKTLIELTENAWSVLGIPTDTFTAFQQHAQTVFKTNQTIQYETSLNLSKGQSHYAVSIIPEGGSDYKTETVLVVARDLTEEKQLQKELIRLDRLNIIGEMAASIGHELRNPLTTIKGYLQYFSSRNTYPQHKEQFATMIEELDRANAIITEFLSLAKNKAITLEITNLNENIEAILPLLQAEANLSEHTIQLELESLPALLLDKKAIRQVLLNLVRNALEASPPGAPILIKTTAETDGIRLSVRDFGLGIPPDIMEKLGTPFVTTKDNGTGLGLSVCYRIADRHHAKLEITTSRKGTMIAVKFPPPT
ncbi:MAG: ATP-binding protein [Sporomusaceae bacterium]|nr:ATP-binding protein [Sporomusaceae bacterium]